MITRDNAGEKLLAHRDDKNLTQVEVSKKSGVSVQTLCLIEGGEVKPQTMTVFKLNKYFKSLGLK